MLKKHLATTCRVIWCVESPGSVIAQEFLTLNWGSYHPDLFISEGHISPARRADGCCEVSKENAWADFSTQAPALLDYVMTSNKERMDTRFTAICCLALLPRQYQISRLFSTPRRSKNALFCEMGRFYCQAIQSGSGNSPNTIESSLYNFQSFYHENLILIKSLTI